MPAVVTLDDVADLNAADQHGHRYELSPEGVLSVMPPPDSEHAEIISDIMIWLAMAGWPARQLLQAAGIQVPGPDGSGGRIPDLTVWAKRQPKAVWMPIENLILVVEVVSTGSRRVDETMKRHEYAHAGIPHFWLVDRDSAQTVTLFVLGADGGYATATKMPLAWLLQSTPADHGLAP